jgi:thiamine phosphate synthase YjbQ (UPF0047 family)
MPPAPLDLTLEHEARSRVEVIDLLGRLSSDQRDALGAYPSGLYWSAHTTAGFLDRRLIQRLGSGRVPNYIDILRRIFPEQAGYAHDHLDRRSDLDDAQRAVEPRNGDSHLAFIAGALRPCVVHPHRHGETACFVDLDGMNAGQPRRRSTRVIGFHRETLAGQMRLRVPLSRHPIESINLKDGRLGLYTQVAEFVARAGVEKGRLHIALGREERDAGLTINEFETLLMKHDLAAVLRNPLRFMAQGARRALTSPGMVPQTLVGYARYDVVRVVNSGLDTLGRHGSRLEHFLAGLVAIPAARMFSLRRSISLLIAPDIDGHAGPVEGRYQSPILIQCRRPPGDVRDLDVTLYRLE